MSASTFTPGEHRRLKHLLSSEPVEGHRYLQPSSGSGCSQYALSLGAPAWPHTLAHAGRGQDYYDRQQKAAELPVTTSGHSFLPSICVQPSAFYLCAAESQVRRLPFSERGV